MARRSVPFLVFPYKHPGIERQIETPTHTVMAHGDSSLGRGPCVRPVTLMQADLRHGQPLHVINASLTVSGFTAHLTTFFF